jgi:hypothetical protein
MGYGVGGYGVADFGALPIDDAPMSIVVHGAKWHRKNNVSGPQGGEVNYIRKMATGPIPALGPIGLMSSDPADASQVYTVEGLGPTRAVVREQVLLTGTIPAYTENSFSRLCRITKEEGDFLVGDVTAFSGNSIIGIMESALNTGTGLEIEEITNFLANTMGRATVDSAFYEKFFLRNDTGEMIGRLEVSEHQSDFKERVLFASDPSYDHDSTSRNRLTKPGDIPPGDLTTDNTLIFMNMPAGASIGVWLRLLIPAGEGTVLNGWKIRVVADGEVQVFTLLHPEGSGRTGEMIFTKRDLHPIGGGNPLRWIELKGGRFVPEQYWPPNPVTFRSECYYNTRLNQLFKRIKTLPVPVWKLVR